MPCSRVHGCANASRLSDPIAIPPSTRRFAPVTYDASSLSSLTRNTAAAPTSRVMATRPIGIVATTSARRSGTTPGRRGIRRRALGNVGVAVGDGHLCAGFRQREGDTAPDPSSAARNERVLAGYGLFVRTGPAFRRRWQVRQVRQRRSGARAPACYPHICAIRTSSEIIVTAPQTSGHSDDAPRPGMRCRASKADAAGFAPRIIRGLARPLKHRSKLLPPAGPRPDRLAPCSTARSTLLECGAAVFPAAGTG